ncbi:low molecular weight protein-tyrosine-phosphatase [Laceyella putida]|uniref:protein-tyrosine-phosphatase n=1 Tax=Laceyella putida TaxID=110101 RepID=A0ABW2RIG7_9BACL
MAEAVFRHYVKAEGLEDQIHIDSAGTGDWHIGEPPHHGTRAKLDEAGISYAGQKARQVKPNDFDEFTYIIGMDDSNVSNMRKIARNPDVTLYRFVDFIPGTTYTKVPDPWYTGDFEETYRLISAGCRYLLDKIKKEHNL